ncbi:sodium- and chloride-dependent glycine transporter 1-like [Patella vulgata]|uniref:sodium- and chloride-dependent glycine transporter 1-like n=1 Tax=Patella vulgata TaxID=6465 RepID=UPI0024A931FE|nr:sodium- and chloride-dependent glycine transporter 1-like [Patella vulgata]
MAEERAQWGRQIEFIFTLIGYAVGLGNVWRFPYLCFRNGGGAFLIPYVICLVFLGIPIFGLEIAFGQFGGKGPISIWKNANPIFKGIGMGGILISAIISIYYDIIIAWALYYLFASMTDKLPWEDCTDCACQLYDSQANVTNYLNSNVTNYLNSTELNCTLFTGQPRSASEIYYRDVVLSESEKLGDWGILKWDLSLCNLLSWTIVFIVLSKGIQSLGKVVYVTAIFPYVLLTILLIRGAMLEGALEGIKYYITPDLSRLTDATVWSDAAVQIFFSLSSCQGGLMAMASYNKFTNNILRDAIMIPVINCLTSFYAGFVVFSVLGYMAHERQLPVANVTQGGAGLAFIVYPEALSKMPISPLWAILFFLMLCMLGFSSQFSTAETAMTGIIDEFPRFLHSGKRRILFRVGVCISGCLLGLPMLTQGGSYLLDLIDSYILGFPTLFMGLIETVAIIWVYGEFNYSLHHNAQWSGDLKN